MTRFLSLLALLIAGPLFAADPTWKAGFAKISITPEQPMWMSGYASRKGPATGTETDLWAKVAVFEDAAGKKVVLVTLDLVGIDRELSLTIRQAIEKKLNISREQVALACSHTHCGPVVGNTLRSMYFLEAEHEQKVKDYTAKLPDRILKAVTDAAAGMHLAYLEWGVGKAGFAVNRRTNPEPKVPELRAKGELKGPTDHDVPVLVARDGKNQITGIVFGYACHATTLSYEKWCGDYPGFAMMELEKAHPGAVALFFAGCGADQNPLPRRTVELAKDYGKQLATAVNDVLAKPMKPLKPRWAGQAKEIALPLHEIPTREALVQQSMDPDKYQAARAKLLLKKLETDGAIPATVPYPIQTWRFGGDLTLVTLGGEVVVDYSLRLKKELGAGTWVMGYANDVMAYIPSARVLKEGGYEGATAMVYYGLPSVWGGQVEELIVTEVHRQAKAVRE